MTTTSNLWAIGYEDKDRGHQVRDQIVSLGWDKHFLILSDLAVAVRHPDGSFTFDRKPLPVAPNLLGCTAVGFLAGLVLGVPLTGATIGAALGGAGTAIGSIAAAGISDDFVRDVEALMKPGTSALFVLDSEGDMDVILHKIHALGGTPLENHQE